MRYAASTLIGPKRARCSTRHQVSEGTAGQLFLMTCGHIALACAWRAAEVAEQAFRQRWEACSDALEPIQALQHACMYSHEEVNTLYGICEGAQAGQLAVVVDVQGQFWWLQTGISYLYRYLPTPELILLTPQTDDPLWIGGGPVQPTCRTGGGQLSSGEGLLLLSEGAYQRGFFSMEADFCPVMEAEDPQQALANVMTKYRTGQHHDISILTIQKIQSIK
jgi:hypothetical protein